MIPDSLIHSPLLVHPDDVLQDDGLFFLRLDDGLTDPRLRSVTLMTRTMTYRGGLFDYREIPGVASICRICCVPHQYGDWAIQLVGDGAASQPLWLGTRRLRLIVEAWSRRAELCRLAGVVQG